MTFLFVTIIAVANVGVGYMAAALMGRGPCRWRKGHRLAWGGWIGQSSKLDANEEDVEDGEPALPSEEEGNSADTAATQPKDNVDTPAPGTPSITPEELAIMNMEAVRRFHAIINGHHNDLSSFAHELGLQSEDEEIGVLQECVEQLKEIIRVYVSGRDQFVEELGECVIDDDAIDSLRNEMILASDIRTAEVCSVLTSLDKPELEGKSGEEILATLREETKEMNETVLNLREIIVQAEGMLVISVQGEGEPV